MRTVHKQKITPRYTKDNGAFVLDTQSLAFPDSFHMFEQSIVYIPSNQTAGNHKHPRSEVFIGIGTELFFYWQDEFGTVHSEIMQDEYLYLIYVPSLIPHAIENKSSSFAILYEYADAAQTNVEKIAII